MEYLICECGADINPKFEGDMGFLFHVIGGHKITVMSATGRGTVREENDFYPTPDYCIQEALTRFLNLEPLPFSSTLILDPCCGKRPYCTWLNIMHFDKVWNVDIACSDADVIADYLTYNVPFIPTLIVTNPPYNIAQDIIEKAIKDVAYAGFVIMLLRLNFLGSQNRLNFWKQYQAKYIFVHAQRPSFRPDGKTDATEYAHFVWQKGYTGPSYLYVL